MPTEFVRADRAKHLHVKLDVNEWMELKKWLVGRQLNITTWTRAVICAELRRVTAKPAK